MTKHLSQVDQTQQHMSWNTLKTLFFCQSVRIYYGERLHLIDDFIDDETPIASGLGLRTQ